ncbi:MAG: hypothetical protein GY856_50170, partial [bacterium]|nr:hypothetical protein [bacterium]
QIMLWELSEDQGIFEGSIDLDDNATSTLDGRLQAVAGDEIAALHDDYRGNSSSEAWADVTQATIVFIDETGRPTAEILESATARVRVFSLQDNTHPYIVDTIAVDVDTRYAADYESVQLTETGADTSVFEGTIDLAFGTGSMSNGTLETSNSGSPEYLVDDVAATYQGMTAYAKTVGSRAYFLDGYGWQVTSYAIGDRIYVRVIDHNRDTPGMLDTFDVSLFCTASGEAESLTLDETGYDTAIFEGTILSSSEIVTSFDGVVQAAVGELIEVSHPHVYGDGYATAQATMNGSATYFIDASGQLTSYYLESSRAIIRVVDSFANSDPYGADTTSVDLTAELTGDQEMVMLTETGDDTGIFEGSIPLAIDPVSTGNGVVETTEEDGPPFLYDTLTATYNDSQGTITGDTATTLGSHTWFIDAYGSVVSTYATGSTVYVRVEDHNYNYDPGLFDNVTVALQSLT